MKIIIGLTGPTGAGKSSLTNVAEALGFKIVDCDLLARKAVLKGTDGLLALTEKFGKEILNSDEDLNRKALAKIAFSTKENTELLNKTILPFIVLLVKEEIEGEDRVILDAPTLFESGINSICNKTVAVLADKDTRITRITERDGLDTESALLRINAGKSDEFYKENADYIIYNDNSKTEAQRKLLKIIAQILGKNIS